MSLWEAWDGVPDGDGNENEGRGGEGGQGKEKPGGVKDHFCPMNELRLEWQRSGRELE